MFNRYWREYPFFLQTLLLGLMLFTLFSAAYIFAVKLTPMITGVAAIEFLALSKDSSREVIVAARWYQLIGSVTIFWGTSFLFAYAMHPKPFQYLGLKKFINPLHILLIIILAIAAIPVVTQTGEWMKHINFGQGMRNLLEQQEKQVEALLQMPNISDLLICLFIMSFVPAFGEELLFRGILMRQLYKRTGNLFMSILISATFFAFFHGSMYIFLPILAMGVVLGYTYYYTGSLWGNVLLHFIFNGTQIVMQYLMQHDVISVGDEDSYPFYAFAIALGVCALLFMALKKTARPLPAGWASDFTPEEIKARLEENNR